jgi:hypothetical protein
MKGYEDQTEQHMEFALKHSGRNPEALAGISLVFSKACRFAGSLFLCILFSTLPAAPSGASEWVLSQKQSELGRYTVYVTRDAIKFVNQTLGYEVVARAPTWKIVIYQPDQKLGCEMSLDKFLGEDVFSFLKQPRKSEKRRLLKRESTDTKGVTICNYGTFDGREQSWTTESLGAPQQAIDIAQCCYRLKNTPGFPLRVIAHFGPAPKIPNSSWMSGGINLGQYDWVETLKTDNWKKVPYRISDFTYPANFKNTQDVHVLILSRSKQNSLEDLFEDMGVGKKLGESKK